MSEERIREIESRARGNELDYAVLRRIAHACGIEWGPDVAG